MWNFALLSTILFWVCIALKKFGQVLSYVVCTQVRRHVHKQITKRRYREEKAKTFFFRKTSFVHSRSVTYCALLLGYFGLKFLPNGHHCVYCVLAEIWAPDSSHRIGNKKNFITARAERKVRLCVKLFDFFAGEHSFVWPEVCRVLPQIQWRFLRGILGKKYFRRIFQNFFANPGYHPLAKLVKFRPTFCNFILGPYCAEKICTSTFLCCLHPGKEACAYTNHKRRYEEEKPKRFVFGKPVLFIWTSSRRGKWGPSSRTSWKDYKEQG